MGLWLSFRGSFFSLIFLLANTGYALDLAHPHNSLILGGSRQQTTLPQVLSGVKKGSVVIVSELHGHIPHHENQRAVISELQSMAFKVSVGMEFFSFTQQSLLSAYLNSFLSGSPMSDEDFLKAVGWGGDNFDNWKPQILYTIWQGGWTIGLNSPRSLSSRVSRVGVEGLTSAEKKLLPPNFKLGNEKYRERFEAVMGGHGGRKIPKETFDRYFAAQSLWDDTMAWRAADYLHTNPDQVLVILVGDFHVAYGGGLPERLKARGVQDILTISQINTHGLSRQEQDFLIENPQWGSRADIIWISDKKL